MGVCNTMTKEENIVARLTVITLDALRDHKPIAVSTARDALDLLNDQAVAYKKLEAENARLETERDNWIETAREYANNADFFRSLVVKCGVAIGAESYIQDDGGISEDVLCIKVPTLVEKLIAENARLRDAVLNAYHTGHDHTVEGGFQWCAVGSQEVADEIIAEALNPTSAGGE